jgi:outer membrane protein W
MPNLRTFVQTLKIKNMKKLLVLVGAVALVGSTFAQKPSADDSKYSLEGNLNYAAGTGIQWSAPTVRFRYFVNDNIAARVQLGLGNGVDPRKEVFNFAENIDGSGAVGTKTITRMSWMAQIGGEYHLAGTDRFSPYFMLGVNFGGGSRVEEWSNSNGTAYQADLSAKVENKVSTFGVNIGAGMDYYVAENIYLGFELGLGVNNRNVADGTTSVTTGGVTTTSKSLGGSVSSMGTSALNTAFRLGWRF